jgi:hypothetical protein
MQESEIEEGAGWVSFEGVDCFGLTGVCGGMQLMRMFG